MRGNVNAAPVRDPVGAVSSNADLYTSFGRTMAEIGGFEKSPHLAIGLSGGSDSVALLHLAREWAKSHGARITALTVDHGLRPHSRDEAEVAGKLSRDLGADHQILTWDHANPTSGVQSAARKARYQLMNDWCRDNAVLHLLAGHTREDQIETYLMRQHHGSGPEGLAGMSQIIEMPACRLVRPLLSATRQKLRGYLNELQVGWADDPSNQDEQFERVRWRNHILKENLSIPKLGETVKACGQQRQALNRALVEQAARHISLHPIGYATVSVDGLDGLPKVLAVQVLARLLATIGGRSFVPSVQKTEPLWDRLGADHAASVTAAGCRLIRKGRSFRVFREHRNLPLPRQIAPQQHHHWDQRFTIQLGKGLKNSKGSPVLRPFEGADWDRVLPQIKSGHYRKFPLEICKSLPVIADDAGLLCIPHLEYIAGDHKNHRKQQDEIVQFLSFSPLKSLSGSGFSVA